MMCHNCPDSAVGTAECVVCGCRCSIDSQSRCPDCGGELERVGTARD